MVLTTPSATELRAARRMTIAGASAKEKMMSALKADEVDVFVSFSTYFYSAFCPCVRVCIYAAHALAMCKKTKKTKKQKTKQTKNTHSVKHQEKQTLSWSVLKVSFFKEYRRKQQDFLAKA